MRKQKREKFKIPIPEGKKEETVFVSPSSSGYVLGVAGSDRHITVVKERKSISSHSTFQSKGKSEHLGRLHESDITENFWVDTLKIKKMRKNQLDKPVFYLTKKMASLLNIPDDVLFMKKETEKEIISQLDVDEIRRRTSLLLQELGSNPENFMGLCPARTILTTPKIIIGMFGKGKAVINFEGELYSMDLSPILEPFLGQDNQVHKTPLSKVLQSLGVFALRSDLIQRCKDRYERPS